MSEKSVSSLQGTSGKKSSTSIMTNTGSPVSEVNGILCVISVFTWIDCSTQFEEIFLINADFFLKVLCIRNVLISKYNKFAWNLFKRYIYFKYFMYIVLTFFNSRSFKSLLQDSTSFSRISFSKPVFSAIFDASCVYNCATTRVLFTREKILLKFRKRKNIYPKLY